MRYSVFHRRVQILSPHPEQLIDAIAATGDRHEVSDEIRGGFDWVVSFGHRKIVREPFLTEYRDRIINLHISLLPWNRGAHPNVWAWHDGTPHGVTIHHIDAGLDTGDIIAQREVAMGEDETLATSYAKLHRAMAGLFAETWPIIRAGRAARIPQPTGGSYHCAADLDGLNITSWDMPVKCR